VAAKGKYVAVVSTAVETKDPKAEIAPALKLLDKIDQQFFWVSDQYVSCNDSKADGCYITESYDATTHFEKATTEVLDLFFKLTGKPLDLSISAEPDDLDPNNQSAQETATAPAAAAAGSGAAAAAGSGAAAAAATATATAPDAKNTCTGCWCCTGCCCCCGW